MATYFLCSLGSNIEPEYNVSRAKSYLAGIANDIHYSRIIRTEPVAMPSSNTFLNALFLIATPLPADKLKLAFNSIETSLGRDRSDPDSSIKDRQLDLDILGEVTGETWPPVPDYLIALNDELKLSFQSFQQEQNV